MKGGKYRYNKYWQHRLEQLELFDNKQNQRSSKMAIKKSVKSNKVEQPVKRGRPANPDKEDTSDKKTVVIFLDPKLHARVRLACIALGTNVNKVSRQLLAEWCSENKKAIADVINAGMAEDDEDETEVEEDEDTEVEEDDSDDDE